MSWTLVTGSAKGLGAEIARKLASDGHNVVIHYRKSRDEANAVVELCREMGVNADLIVGDFSSKKQVQAFIEEYKERFHESTSIVHNVGYYKYVSAMETSEDLWYDLFQVNFHAPVIITKALHESLKCVLSIGVSGLGKSRGVKEAIAYTATKEALWSWTRSLAKELEGKTTVNMVSPGELENSVTLKLRDELPKGRPGYLSEVAEVVAFLLSKKGEYISGQNIEVDGGKF